MTTEKWTVDTVSKLFDSATSHVSGWMRIAVAHNDAVAEAVDLETRRCHEQWAKSRDTTMAEK